MDNHAENVAWIENELVPSLVADGKLTYGSGGRPAVVNGVDIKRISIEESIMLSICYRVLVKLGAADATVDEKEAAAVSLVIKITPKLPKELFDQINFGPLFHNEILAYEKIFPALGWSEGVPKFYYAHLREAEGAIVMGDFAADGWKMPKSKVDLSLEHILVSVKELGKLHGNMYGLKHSDRNAFDQIKNDLQESRFRFDETAPTWAQRLNLGPKRAIDSVRQHPEMSRLIPEEFLANLEEGLTNTYLYQKRRVVPEEPLAVLCHGDYLRNNIAFKYIDDDWETPEAALPFDFQTLRYSSPMVDFTTLLMNSAGSAVRAQHFDEIFNTYHSSLVSHYGKHTGTPSSSLPGYLSSDSLLREYAVYLPFGFSIAASFLPVLYDPVDFTEFADISEEDNAKDAYERGGEPVDRELRAALLEIYQHHTKLQLKFKML